MRSAKGSVRKLGNGRWRVVVEAKRDPETGKRRRLSKVVRGTRRQAEEVKLQLLADAGSEVPLTSVTVAEYAEQVYLPAKSTTVKATTLSGYRMRLERYVLPTFGDRRLQDVDAPSIRSWLAGMERSKAVEAYRAFEQLMSFALYDDRIERSPFERVRKPRKPRYEPTVLDAGQMAGYLELFRGSTVEAAVLLAAGCGLRRGEICGLDAEDIGWDDGTVTVSRTYISVDGVPQLSTPKSETSARTVHMPRALLERLREIAPEHGPVLVGRDGRMTPDAVSRAYRRVLDASDIEPKIPLKNLRHSSLTLAYDSGARLLDVRDRAGHSSEAITARYYVRPKTSGDAEIAEAMDDMLLRAPIERCQSGENRPE